MNLSICGAVTQVTGLLAPTPRGSKPTMSNESRMVWLKTFLADLAKSTPEAPGPPGFTSSEPMRLDGSAAGSLISLSEMRSPAGTL